MIKDIKNQKFGLLTPIKMVSKDKYGNLRWLCLCNCGKEKIINKSALISGRTKSCGCLNRKLTARRFLKHGHTQDGKVSSIYSVWNHMLDRCNNPKNKRYKDYGGRGIIVCERWLKFENFLKDVVNIPDGLTLDRINNNGNYEPNNWRLSTIKEQGRNKRNNHLIPYNGKELCISECEETLGFKHGTIKRRIYRGWPIEKALTTPVQIRKK